ncbi:hypothetical protein M0802_003063 [Mischocyttarus mexicanus]|nr:hypothetical protein M0802_003063 [Mischocyttarus mexicanus]
MKGSLFYSVAVLAIIFFKKSSAELCNEDKPKIYLCQGLTNLAQLDSLPDSVVGLRLEKSNISRIPADAFSRFAASLIELRITGSSLESIEAHAFRNLDKLETLDLSNNRIQAIEASWVQGLSNLKKLNLYTNLISRIDPAFYDLVPKLEVLDIANNGLVECVTKNVLSKLKNLRLILIGSNPWSYRCRASMTYQFKTHGVNFIKDWSIGDLMIEECLAHEPGADSDDKVLRKCVDEKSFESISPILPQLQEQVYTLTHQVEALRKKVEEMKKCC